MMGAKFHGHAIERFKRMPQHHQFHLSVNCRALHRLRNPGVADFHTTIQCSNIAKSSRAHDAIVRNTPHHKRHHRPPFTLAQTKRNIGRRLIGRRHAGKQKIP